MDLATPPPAQVQRLCPRCHGASEGSAQFCRFCGASLAAAQAIPMRLAAPNPVASAPTGRGADVAAPVDFGAAPLPPSPSAAPSHAAIASPSRARLVLIARDGGEGPSFPLAETTDIGRTEGQVVIAEDRYISPRHARIAQRRGLFYLRDLQSTNGMFVRIPFPRERPADRPGGGAPGIAPAAAAGGAAVAGAAGGNPDNQASAEQALADQDLFLVGQQVLRFEVVNNAEEGFGVASENGTLLFGTPAAPRYARLSQRTVEGVGRDVFHVHKSETVIGREQGDIVFNDDPFLSRRHCVLRVNAAGAAPGGRSYALADLGSSNGTFLQVREEVRLRHGDHFRIGQQLFRFDT